ncbi:MAG: YajQ family cyclic di-GMP-binding protein [Gammaproteobacteria bacterium]
MPSFDVVSQVDQHELRNAVDQTNREIEKRFDFKGTTARVEQSGRELTITGETEFQIRQIVEILHVKMAKRGIDLGCLQAGEIIESGKESRQAILAKHGIDKETAKAILKAVKESKLKVQAMVQGEEVRVTGKKRDDLQEIIRTLREKDFGQPLQYINFRE